MLEGRSWLLTDRTIACVRAAGVFLDADRQVQQGLSGEKRDVLK
jgi:hypothetical protein